MNNCIAILRSGLNKNNPCNRITKNGEYCGIHKKLNLINESMENDIRQNTQQNIQNNTQQNIQNNIDQLNDTLNNLNLGLNANNTNSDNLDSINTNHEIYIVQLSEHIRCNDNIYKVGMTTRGIKQRIKGYPKNTQILFSMSVKNANQCEREVMKQCRTTIGITNCNRNHSEKTKQLGNEYFEADYNLLKNIVENTCKNFNQTYKVI
jgi:hypothetical protein